MSTLDEARKHVAEARRCHDKDISLGGCLSSMISAFEIVVETLIALPDARAVAEDVYAEKAKPVEVERPPFDASGLQPATSPTDTGAGEAVHLDECPPGLFSFDGTLGFKTEYATKDEKTGRYHAEAYVVESGEFFWGGTSTFPERGALVVTPLGVDALRYRDDEAVSKLVRERDEALASLAEKERRIGEVRAKTIDAAIAICAGWLAQFENGNVQHVSPTAYAADAVRDIAENIQALRCAALTPDAGEG